MSENLIYDTLNGAINEMSIRNIGILCHYPLSRLIENRDILTERERYFIDSPFSHVDFLLYHRITKQPVIAVEVDGWKYHNESEIQQSRDSLKNSVFAKCGLNLYRISTTDTVSVESIKTMLSKYIL